MEISINRFRQILKDLNKYVLKELDINRDTSIDMNRFKYLLTGLDIQRLIQIYILTDLYKYIYIY